MIFERGTLTENDGSAKQVCDVQIVTASDEDAYYNQPVDVCWRDNIEGLVEERRSDLGAYFWLSCIHVKLDDGRTLTVP